MKNSISGLLAGLLATGCASLPPMKGNPWDRDVNYAIEDGKETERFEGKSDFTVVLFPEDHLLYGCQANIYLALEKNVLAGEVRFVAREGRVGPTEHDGDAFQTKRFFDRNLQVLFYKDLIDLPYIQRQELARSWAINNDFPSQYSFYSWTGKTKRDWTIVKPMISTVLNESVHQHIHTIGVESKKALDQADRELSEADEEIGKAKNILSEAYVVEKEDKEHFSSCMGEQGATFTGKADPKTEKIFAACKDRLIGMRKNHFLDIVDEQIKYRNAGFVTNIQKYASKINFVEGPLVLFPVGAMHVPDLTKRFKNESISYRVIEHKACIEKDIY